MEHRHFHTSRGFAPRGVHADRYSPLGAALRRVVMLIAALGLCVAALAPVAPARPQDAQSGATPVAVPAARQANNVAIITIKGSIDADTELSVKRRMNEAVKAGAHAIVFDIDSPGGEVGAVLAICNEIKRCPIANTIAWVNPEAYSGGAIIALACREIVIASAATMGDAAPIQVAFGMFLNTLPEAERAKLLAPLLAEVVESARLRGYDEKLVQGFISLGVELWLVESLERPGEVLFIDRAEYEIAFGTEPSAAAPTLVGPSPTAASGTADGAKPAAPPPASVEELLKKVQKQVTKKKRGASGAPTNRPTNSPAPGDESTKFIPAGTAMSAALGADVSDGLETPSGRPILTEAKDRGKWRLVEKVSDGRSLYTLKQRELFDYRLAARGPSSDGTIDTDEELKEFLGAKHLARLDRNALEAVSGFLRHILVRGILIVVFLVGLFIELIHPGLIFPGSAAAIALLLLVAPALIMGLGAWWQVGAILLGIVLLGVEVFIMPGFGAFGVLGLLSMFGGLIGTLTMGAALFPDSPGRGDVLYGVATLAIATITSGVVVYFVVRNIGTLPMINKLVLQGPNDGGGAAGAGLLGAMDDSGSVPVAIGEIGVALSPMRPSGRAQFGDVIADVTSESGYIAAGQSVRVVEASAFRIVIEPATGDADRRVTESRGGGLPPSGGSTTRGQGGRA